MALVSVVMATYNGEKYIQEQIDSILSQSVCPNQILIIDDCSTDNTWNILQKYKKNNERIIEIVRNEKNMGIIETFKRGIEMSAGDYLFLSDQDDIWEKNKIELCLKIAVKYDSDIITTGLRLVDSNSQVIEETEKFRSDPICGYSDWTYNIYSVPLEKLIWGNFTPGCTYCVNRRIVSYYLNTNNKEILHDYQLFMIAANRGKAIYYDAPLIRYRLHDANAVGMNNKEKKRKRYFRPRIVRFLNSLSIQERITKKLYIYVVLYMRLPKVRSMVIHFLGRDNDRRKSLQQSYPKI